MTQHFATPSAPGTPALWRSVHPGHVSAVIPGLVVEDSSEVVAHYQPSGTSMLVRSGRRGGPRGRNMEPGGWDGGYLRVAWVGAGVVRVHPRGEAFSVWRWLSDDGDFRPDFYVNLEEPWSESAFGYDSQDWILDLIVAGDLQTWQFKDEDELEWAVESGGMTTDKADRIIAAGERALSWVKTAQGPFGADWQTWKPDANWSVDFRPDLQRASIAPATRITEPPITEVETS